MGAGANEEKFENQDGQVQVETSQRQSLTHRISSLYETIISKAAPKKSDRSGATSAAAGGIGNAAADVDTKEGAIVYAELDLKAPAEGTGSTDSTAVRMIKDQTTEYAEILPVKTTSSPAE